MTISVGHKIPSVKIKAVTADGTKDIDTAELFAGKKVVMFSLPGAFTPTCSAKHLPGYVAKADELKAKGVDMIACLSVNDHHVMAAWAKEHSATGIVTMLADGNAAFTKALGIEGDLSAAGMGERARRGVFLIEDGVVKTIELEAPGKFEVSSAEACSIALG
ncbi:MAG: peroxiredoxin [Kofleriaceae bacterium]|nr:peroxiredoxin [Kofleriaceae bacterium]